MKPSPIQLMQMTFNKIHVQIDPKHAPPEPASSMLTMFGFDGVSITTEVGLGELDMEHERGPVYAVSLRLLVDNQPSDDEPNRRFSPYLIDIETAGAIRLRKGAEKLGLPADLVTVNGTGLLWSAIREQLLTLTSRMPAGPVMLPTVHFHDLKKAPANDAKGAAVTKAQGLTKKPARKKPAPAART